MESQFKPSAQFDDDFRSDLRCAAVVIRKIAAVFLFIGLIVLPALSRIVWVYMPAALKEGSEEATAPFFISLCLACMGMFVGGMICLLWDADFGSPCINGKNHKFEQWEEPTSNNTQYRRCVSCGLAERRQT